MSALLRLACTGLLAAALCACGDAPQARHEVRWMHSKPNPAVGSVRAAVVARPAPDRAVLEAHWENLVGGEACNLELVLPEGVILRTGTPFPPLAPDEAGGMATWEVEFPRGQPLDAVIRFCVDTPEGLRACEAAVRLTD